MIPALFQNANFLLVAAALISVPIIIHLINRMRFKRIRWAAMEFLLKAQKRTRRRLIIEQLLLLALRCLLIALVGLLVSRFIGCGDNNLGGKPNLHLVLLDDTLSMQDFWKGPEGTKSAFDVAKNDFLVKKIAKGLGQSKTTDQLIIVPFSKLVDDGVVLEPKTYEHLNDSQKMKELISDINEMQPSMLNVNPLRAVKTAQRIIGKFSKSRVTLHILSDFRDVDWGGKSGETLTKELLEMVQVNKELRIRPIDTVFPDRTANQGGYPPARDNVGIVDFRPDTRIAGHKMPVTFTVKIANFSGKLVEVKLTARNETIGKDMEDVDFDLKSNQAQKDRTRIELTPNNITEVSFDYGDVKRGVFFPNLQEGKSDFAHISVRLTNAAKQPLENDAISADNIRHTVLEVRDKVPILVIDGLRDASRKGEGKDSFVLERTLPEVPGKSYQMIFGDQLPGCGQDAAKALERYDLNKYPTIFLLNVPLLKKEQIANLETFVKDGGGVCFYMGPDVSAKHYNEKLYRGGEGVFPAPLKTSYYPPQADPEIPTKQNNDVFELITREDKFGSKPLPIFSKIFFEPKQRFPLMNLPIHRYFKVDRGAWKQDANRVFELATLPNDSAARDFEQRVAEITQTGINAREVLKNPEFAKYRDQLLKHFRDIEDKVKAGTEFKAYHLANQIEIMLNDKGSDNPPIPDLNKFWASGDDKVQLLKKQFTDLKEDVNYGDPFVVMQNYGKGKVVAVMSTCGRDWNDWAGGSMSQVLFPAFIWELQNELSSPGEEGNLTVGTTLPPLTFDARQFQGERLKLVRYFVKTSQEKPGEPGEKIEQFGEEKEGKIPFKMTNHLLPGLYVSELYKANGEKPIAKYAHTFNVDTAHEGRLQRIGDELTTNLADKANEITKTKDTVKIGGLSMSDEVLVAKTDDLSESPWLFLVLLLVLVAEQALAVHLSFHLKDNEGDLAPAGVKT